jgi:O-antigen/teichoic acid export membrane protein
VAALGPDLLRLMTPRNPAFWAAAPIIPVVALAYLLHGLFLLTSVGIGIAKHTRYYAFITALAASANIGADVWLVPSMGIAGAAWATVLAYALMALLGALASRRSYRIPFEWPALLGLLGAGAATTFAASFLGGDLWGTVVRKVVLLGLFGGTLASLGWQRWRKVG